MAENYSVMLARDAYRIGPDIYKNTINNSVWNRLTQREAWTDGIGNAIQVLTVNRNLPANVDAWTDLAMSNGAVTPCNQQADEVPFGYTLRNYNLQQKTLKSIPVCVEDARGAMQASEQIAKMYENLTESVNYIWKRRYMLEYARVSENKIVAAPHLPKSKSHFPNTPPLYKLNTRILKKLYHELIANSAEADGGSLAMSNGKPVFILVTDMETSDDIMNEDKNRQAFLWNASRVPELLQPLGVDREYNGFFHTIEKLPRHFNFTNGQYEEVAPYETVETTEGTEARLTTAWLNAPITESYIYLPVVMKCLVPNKISTLGSGMTFNPSSYMGEFVWRNIVNHDDNPFESWGKYHARMQMGTKPVKPQFGYAIRHLRCPADLEGTRCAGGESETASEIHNLSDSHDVSYDA